MPAAAVCCSSTSRWLRQGGERDGSPGLIVAPSGGELPGVRVEALGSPLVERVGALDDDGDDSVAVRRLRGTPQPLAGVGLGGEHARFGPGRGAPRQPGVPDRVGNGGGGLGCVAEQLVGDVWLVEVEGEEGVERDLPEVHVLIELLRWREQGLGDPELLGRAIIATSIDAECDDAYSTYERTRNRLTVPILTAADEIASFEWNDDRIAELLLELNAAMNDELDVITGFVHRQPIHPPAIAAQATH